MKILITGAAGFVGMHTAVRLLERGDEVVGIDNLNDYYTPLLKDERLNILAKYENFTFRRMNVADHVSLTHLFANEGFDRVIHLAAQAGVRYSITNPHAYGESNLSGFLNILEACRNYRIQHLVYASSSSVYGGNKKMPFSEKDSVDHPVSLYAATKKANELMAHTYSHLYQLPTTGLRFFTVYGPWGRPDMAYFSFAKNITDGVSIPVFNFGRMKRDFTYIDDIVDGVVAILDKSPAANPDFDRASQNSGASTAPYRIFNIGNQNPVELSYFIETIECAIGKKALIEYLPMQPGDVEATFADVSSLTEWTGLIPKISLEDGIGKFIDWYKNWTA